MRRYRFAVAVAAVISSLGLATFAPSNSAANAATRPTPTPTPVALQYDEIDRIVMAPATAPPPGSFQGDFSVVMSGQNTTAAAATATPSPTPAPHHRGLGSMIGNVLSGNIAGAAVDQTAQNAQGNMMQNMPGVASMDALNQLRNGRLTRYTFYYSRGWVREDDPLAQTATISKCNEHVFISLDLKNKTYRKSDTTPAACHSPGMTGKAAGGAPVAQAPGTVDLTVSATSQNLGPRTLENIATTGYDDAMSMKMANATGSCRNGDFSMNLVQYISGITKPRAYCPLNRTIATGPQSFSDGSGGCKPTMHATGGAMAHSDKLEMYTKMTMGSGGNPPSSFANVVERGNVKWLFRPQADPLFDVPPGFTQQN